jgi:hypothetical protein
VPAAGNYNAIDERGYLISPQQYDLWRTYSYLPSGTYRVYFDVSYGADRGIVELYVDDTLAGSINSYASSGSRYTLPLNSTGARNTIPLLASAFQITVSGVKKIELFVSRKDGASNNFYIVWRGMCFLKTA